MSVVLHRIDNLAARLGMTTDVLLSRINERSDIIAAVEQALAEPAPSPVKPSVCRLAPEHTVTTVIAKLAASHDLIEVSSEWDQTIIDTVKPLGYRWDKYRWVRRIGALSAPLADRLVELGVHLLAAGVVIQVPSETLSIRIAASDYMPERKRWVAVSKLDRYDGWFYIFWPYGEPYAAAAKRITGARLFRSSAVVPSTVFDEVVDFAERHGFGISDKALALIAKAQAERDAMFIANPRLQPPSKPATVPAPSLTDDTGILPDLADYD